MSAISRRTMITRGLVAAAGLSGLGVAERIAGRYGLVPPDGGGIYGPGETLTYATHRLLTQHSLAREFSRPSDVAKPGKELDGHAHATLSASANAFASSGSAVAPSIQTSPPSKNSRFQIGAICFTRSMAYRHAENACPRCGDAAAIATLTPPTSIRPIR